MSSTTPTEVTADIQWDKDRTDPSRQKLFSYVSYANSVGSATPASVEELRQLERRTYTSLGPEASLVDSRPEFTEYFTAHGADIVKNCNPKFVLTEITESDLVTGTRKTLWTRATAQATSVGSTAETAPAT